MGLGEAADDRVISRHLFMAAFCRVPLQGIADPWHQACHFS